MNQVLIGILCGIGLYFVLADIYRIPYLKSSKAVNNLSKKQKDKSSGLDVWLKGIPLSPKTPLTAICISLWKASRSSSDRL